ncbi:MAG: hypothetical protein LC127_07490 [Chitinophagales bacterium]|nr:hypothetical protein [Chitinophagales bacterium]
MGKNKMILSSKIIKNTTEPHHKIINSFCLENFPLHLIDEIDALVNGDISFEMSNIKKRSWRAISSLENSGQFFLELEALIQWWTQKKISPIYATSMTRLKQGRKNSTIVMKFNEPDYLTINQIQQGGWMFGNISDIASQRISDWRYDVYFSNPLKFLVLSIYDGDGGTGIAGPSDLIDLILKASKNSPEEERIYWKEL